MVNRPKPLVLLLLDGFVYSLGKIYNAILCNYANCDMANQTGIMDASILAVEAVNASLQRIRIVAPIKPVAGQMLITADHGNIEQIVDKETGQPHTAHTTNPVPLLYAGGGKALDAGGSLSDLVATILAMLGVEQPVEMTGRSLIKVV